MHNPELMRQIADAMEVSPDEWWWEFEFLIAGDDIWHTCENPGAVTHSLHTGDKIRRRPPTISVNVEVLQPMRGTPKMGQRYWFLSERHGIDFYVWRDSENDRRIFKRGVWDTEAKAQQVIATILASVECAV